MRSTAAVRMGYIAVQNVSLIMKETPPFRFKQFTVHQSRAAMKVGFDGILLGAWANVAGCQRILDVGTGTGLLALMLAQRTANEYRIDAIDVDQGAIADATENFRASPWSDRLALKQISVEELADALTKQFDLIVCNPPYFDGSILPSNAARAKARHANALSVELLFQTSSKLVRDPGRLSLIVPIENRAVCKADACRFGWTVRRELEVRSLPHRPLHRVLLEFETRSTEEAVAVDSLTIEREHHVYTDEFRHLAKDFYLAF